MKNIKQRMREMLDIQGRDGNWNYDGYMHGMYNGMEFMMSIYEGREPVYRDAPSEWIKDNPRHLIAVPTTCDGDIAL